VGGKRAQIGRTPYPKWALICIALLESLGEAVVMTYLTEPGGKTGRTKGERDLRNGGDEHLEVEGMDLLRSCRGFTVEFGYGWVGRVTEVVFASLSGKPKALIVETGLFQRRSVEVPVADVASVVLARRRVALRCPGVEGVAGQGRIVHVPPKNEVGAR
jgi:uncharacterized protein YrrD